MPAVSKPQVIAAIVVKILDTGQVEVGGAIDNPMFAIGALEMARFQLLLKATTEESRIVAPRGF